VAATGQYPERLLVLGGGPAGATAALRLAALGYPVTLISEPRPFAAIEGVSERVIDGLRQAGFSQALERLPAPTPRRVTWNGLSSAANRERLIERRAFDRTLLADLERAGVRVIQGRVRRLERCGEGHRALVTQAEGTRLYPGDFLIEARGRRAPSVDRRRRCGVASVSLLQRCRGPVMVPGSAVQSFAEGWAWMAANGAGERYLQLTLDVAHARLPEKASLTGFILGRLRSLPQAAPFLQDAEPLGPANARTSTPSHCIEPVGDDWIRIGDAAMAVDPLSGNGIFQALSSALQAPAVVHTLLRRPQDGELAKRFHRQRVADLFNRYSRIGRDFYAMERQWPEQPFWAARRAWPDSEPLHRRFGLSDMRIRLLPVLEGELIVAREGVVTPDHPLGIWHLGGVPLAPLVRALQQGRERPPLDTLAGWPPVSAEQRRAVDNFIAGYRPAPGEQRG
jgi:flavin-dependent dehydrogenase